MESYKFLQAAETAKVFKMRFSSVFVVDKAKTPELYAATLNDEYKLPFGVMIVLKDGEQTQSAVGDGESVFSASIGLEGAGGSTEVSVEGITDASDLGKELLQVNSESEARTAIGAGTSSLTLAQSQAGIATKPAIAALTAGSTLEEVIAALKA